ncbi:mitochondrial carrier [Pterulicium gracile]|uniref:Mitochondrial carrier n=1 Tax=Pterulicium gracile TaxID=1884261 RepID=A0A5C3QZC5_9AGAR|nr:mitochondrial carrier [Pterula gracilis]
MAFDDLKIAGAFAGVGSGLSKVAVGHGFDTIKTRLQCSPPGTYKNAMDAFKQTIRREGVLALYKGATPPAVGWAAIDSLLLGSLHNYRLFLIKYDMTEPVAGTDVRRLTVLGHGIAGLFAGLTSAILATPVELLKVKLQLQLQSARTDRQFKGPIDCARQVMRVQGLLGMWTGFTGSLAFRSNFFWMFSSFEVLMRGFSSLQGTRYEMSTGLANFLSGGLGAFSFWIMAIPADNVKNRMMSHPSIYPQTPGSVIRRSLLSVVKQIHTEHGFRGFFKGLGPSLLRAFPTNACAFFVYEGALRLMGADKTRH